MFEIMYFINAIFFVYFISNNKLNIITLILSTQNYCKPKLIVKKIVIYEIIFDRKHLTEPVGKTWVLSS